MFTGKYPTRAVDSDMYQIPWGRFEYILGVLSTDTSTDKRIVKWFGLTKRHEKFITELMEILGDGKPEVVSHYDIDKLDGSGGKSILEEYLIRAGGNWVTFKCPKHRDRTWEVYQLFYYGGKNVLTEAQEL